MLTILVQCIVYKALGYV